MPFSRSRSFESMTRSTSSSLARNMPAWRSMKSTRVVLPWSTWATMATFRICSRGIIWESLSKRPGLIVASGTAIPQVDPPRSGVACARARHCHVVCFEAVSGEHRDAGGAMADVILFVDDEPEVLAVLRRIFTAADGYERADRLRRGEEALAILGAREVDLLVTDQRMPGMTGIELIAAARGGCARTSAPSSSPPTPTRATSSTPSTRARSTGTSTSPGRTPTCARRCCGRSSRCS